MPYDKPNILDPSDTGDSITEAIDKNDANVDYVIAGLNSHVHDGEQGRVLPKSSLPDDIAYLTGADFTGKVTGTDLEMSGGVALHGYLSVHDYDGGGERATAFFRNQQLNFNHRDGNGDVIPGLRMSIDDYRLFAENDFVTVSAGTPDAGKPILLNGAGVVDASMLDITVFHYVGDFTPSGAQEYPDTSGEEIGAFWSVTGVDDTNGYTFATGDLSGRTAYNGDLMIWGSSGWALRASTMDPTQYYKLDGSNPITAAFAAGGFQLKNVADPTDDQDAATKHYVDNNIPDTGGIDPVNDPQPNDFGQFVNGTQMQGVSVSELQGMLDFFLTSEFINASTGPSDAGKPIVLNSAGEIDDTMIGMTTFYYVGEFTPTAGTEYPDTTGENPGAFWSVAGVDDSAGYTFTGGDLTGKTAYNGDFMIFGSSGWGLRASDMDPSMYYRLDGTQPLTADFAAGGFQLKNVADPADAQDAATMAWSEDTFLPFTGGTLTGDLLISKNAPYCGVDTAGDGQWAAFDIKVQGVRRWLFGKDNSTENGTNTGSNFAFHHCADDGQLLGVVFSVQRNTGVVTFTNHPRAGAGDPTEAVEYTPKSYVDGFMPRSGGSFSGPITVSESLKVDGVAETYRYLFITTGGVNRWGWFANSEPEDGGDAGSNMVFASFADDGSQKDIIFSVMREHGIISFPKIPSTTGGNPSDDNQLARKAYVDQFLPLAGGTLSGDLVIQKIQPIFNLDSTDDTSAELRYKRGGLSRFSLFMNNTEETGSNVGSDLEFSTFDDAGNHLHNIFKVTRATGATFWYGRMFFSSGIAEKFTDEGSGSATYDLNVSTATTFNVDLASVAATISFSGAVNGRCCSFTLFLKGGTAGVTWPASVKWVNGAPTLGDDDVLVFSTYDGGASWYGFHSGAVA